MTTTDFHRMEIRTNLELFARLADRAQTLGLSVSALVRLVVRQYLQQSSTITTEFHLPIYKQGDDLAACLENTDTPSQALRDYAQSLLAAVDKLESLAVAMQGTAAEIDGDGHWIGVTGPEHVLLPLIEVGLLDQLEFVEELE